jgi:hypothetical protein
MAWDPGFPCLSDDDILSVELRNAGNPDVERLLRERDELLHDLEIMENWQSRCETAEKESAIWRSQLDIAEKERKEEQAKLLRERKEERAKLLREQKEERDDLLTEANLWRSQCETAEKESAIWRSQLDIAENKQDIVEKERKEEQAKLLRERKEEQAKLLRERKEERRELLTEANLWHLQYDISEKELKVRLLELDNAVLELDRCQSRCYIAEKELAELNIFR